jgi:S-adenosylmethionine hydrolase
MAPLVCLLTDFGDSDAYTASMKGVLLSLCPQVNLVDITHRIPPHNILSASYLLYSTWDYFPKATVFVCVVDPGVGTERRELICEAEDKYIVCPDNGTLSLLSRMKKRLSCYVLQRREIERITNKKISSTFHGRDIFAPAAAFICNQQQDQITGQTAEPLILPAVFTETDSAKHLLKGKILHIDGFGNCISSLHKSQVRQPYSHSVEVIPHKLKLGTVNTTFADAAPGSALAYWGSTDFLEIGVRNGNAAQSLSISQLDEIALSLDNLQSEVYTD